MPRIAVRGPSGETVAYSLDRDLITIGREESRGLALADPAVSRNHAEVLRDGDRWIVADLDSHNGTLLNGRPVEGPQPLDAGDEIRVGNTIITFEPTPAGAEADREEFPTLPLPPAGTAGEDGELVVVGESPAIREVLGAVERVAPSSATVLILGESGSGKELVARLLHHLSPRRAGPFVVVNCPALPGSLLEAELFGVEKGVATGVEARTGLLETAAEGTLLLDEVGDMEPSAQGKILRFLQDKELARVGGREPIPVNVRLLAATNHDLEEDIRRGSFRRDLYYRLSGVTLNLPPLRDRREDIPLLAEHFLSRREGPAPTLGPEALEVLMRHDWPGNVRELERVLERARLFAEGSVIGVEDLPEALREGGGPREDPDEVPGRLYERIVGGGASFWDVVRGPFLRREVSREQVCSLIERAYGETGSYKGVARLFGMEEEHKKLLNFLWNHDLRVKK